MAEVKSPRLAFSAALLASASTVGVALQFVLNVVLARVLSKTGLGTYKEVFLLYSVVAPFFTMALPASLLYMIPRLDPERRKKFTAQTVVVLAGFGLVFGLGLFLTADVWASVFHNPDLARLIRLFAPLPLFALPGSIASTLAVAYERPKLAASISLALGFGGFGLTCAAAVLTGSVSVTLVASVVSAAVSLIAVLIMSVRLSGGFPLVGFDRGLLREQFVYSVPLGLSSLAGLLAYQTDRLIVSTAFTPALFAVYTLGAVEVPFVTVIGSSVSAVLTPRISQLFQQSRFAEIVDLYREAVRKTAVVVLPFFGYLMFLAPEFFAFLYPGYQSSVPIFRVYLLLLPLRVASYGLILQATGRTKPILYGSVIYLVSNAVVSIALVRVLGMVGPAWGTVATTFAIAAYYLAGSARQVDSPMWRLLPLRSMFALLLASCIAGSAAWLASLLLPGGPLVDLIGGAIVYLPVYAGVGLVSRGMRRDDIDRVVNALRRALRRKSTTDEDEATWPSGDEIPPVSTNEPSGMDSEGNPMLL